MTRSTLPAALAIAGSFARRVLFHNRAVKPKTSRCSRSARPAAVRPTSLIQRHGRSCRIVTMHGCSCTWAHAPRCGHCCCRCPGWLSVDNTREPVEERRLCPLPASPPAAGLMGALWVTFPRACLPGATRPLSRQEASAISKGPAPHYPAFTKHQRSESSAGTDCCPCNQPSTSLVRKDFCTRHTPLRPESAFVASPARLRIPPSRLRPV